MMKNVFVTASAILMLSLLAACSALQPTSVSTATAEVLPTTGIQYYFVTNKLLIPITQEQTQEFALNVDGDSQGHPDNMFGELVTLLTSAAPDLELQSTLDQTINTGQLVSLHLVKADDPLNDPSVSWSLFLGQKTQSSPTFDGFDEFAVDSSSPTNSPIVGSIANGRFAGGAGTARVQIFLMGQLVDVSLIGVRLEADLSAQGCTNGTLGGGVTVDEFRSKLLPTIAVGLNKMINADNGAANTALKSLDSDNNGTISTTELENNPLLMIALSPDLDLLDASGTFDPNQDGMKDSYSIGLGFTCVAAAFIAPN